MHWRSPALCSGRDLPPGLDHRLPVSASAIGCQRRRRLGVAALFELTHQVSRDFFFGLGDGASDAEPRLAFDRRAAPEGTALGLLREPPFSPLWPTKVQRASSCARLNW